MIEAMTAVWTQSKSEGSDLLVFLAIANEYNHHYGAAWPTLEYLCEMSRLSERQVRYSVRKLEDLKELAVDLRAVKNDAGKWVNRYRILIPIAHRRPVKHAKTTGADYAPVENRGGQMTTGTGANDDSAYKEDPLKDPVKVPDTDLTPARNATEQYHRDHPDMRPGKVLPARGRRRRASRHDAHVFCGSSFCVDAEKHSKFQSRIRAAGGKIEDYDLKAMYVEYDQEFETANTTDHPALFLEKQFSAALRDEFGNQPSA